MLGIEHCPESRKSKPNVRGQQSKTANLNSVFQEKKIIIVNFLKTVETFFNLSILYKCI